MEKKNCYFVFCVCSFVLGGQIGVGGRGLPDTRPTLQADREHSVLLHSLGSDAPNLRVDGPPARGAASKYRRWSRLVFGVVGWAPGHSRRRLVYVTCTLTRRDFYLSLYPFFTFLLILYLFFLFIIQYSPSRRFWNRLLIDLGSSSFLYKLLVAYLWRAKNTDSFLWIFKVLLEADKRSK